MCDSEFRVLLPIVPHVYIGAKTATMKYSTKEGSQGKQPTVPELREECRRRGLSNFWKLRKAGLISLLKGVMIFCARCALVDSHFLTFHRIALFATCRVDGCFLPTLMPPTNPPTVLGNRWLGSRVEIFF